MELCIVQATEHYKARRYSHLRATLMKAKKNSVAFNLQANYTDWAAAAVGQKYWQIYAGREVWPRQGNGSPRPLI
jgi:hypothetical protein